jgi:glucose-6-phosphate 1-epimerase
MIGTLTRRAIVAEQQRLGLVPADGRAGRKILEALRAANPQPVHDPAGTEKPQ